MIYSIDIIVNCQDDFGLDPSLLHKKDLDSSQQFLVGFSDGTGVPKQRSKSFGTWNLSEIEAWDLTNPTEIPN